jgi:GcrA cell cycle regulator
MGAELGTSRNSVIGRLRRDGLSPISRKPNGGGGRKRNLDTHGQFSMTAHPSDRRGAVTALKRSPAPRRPDYIFGRPNIVQAWKGKLNTSPPLGGVSFWNIHDGECHWPYGGSVVREDSEANTFRFCGAEIIKGSPYCGFHARIAYRWGNPSE